MEGVSRRIRAGITLTLFLGRGLSVIDKNRFFERECSTAQAISQLLHPTHLEGSTYINSYDSSNIPLEKLKEN
jgi:hypothetical protein